MPTPGSVGSTASPDAASPASSSLRPWSGAPSDDSLRPLTSEGRRRSPAALQALLGVLVVVTGCANNISKQIAAKPLTRYSYMLGLANSVIYLPVYGSRGANLEFTPLGEPRATNFAWIYLGDRGHCTKMSLERSQFLGGASLGWGLYDTIF